MKVQLLKDLKIKCNACECESIIDKNTLDSSTSSYERSMGTEIVYSFLGSINCPKCNTTLDYGVNVAEYPTGAFNSSFPDNNNCEFVEDPVVDIEFKKQ